MQHDDDLVHQNLMSLQTHVLAEEAKHPGATGDLSWIISATFTMESDG